MKSSEKPVALPLFLTSNRPTMPKARSSKFSINVAVRIRPLLGHDRRQQACIQSAEGNVVRCLDPEKLYNDGAQKNLSLLTPRPSLD